MSVGCGPDACWTDPSCSGLSEFSRGFRMDRGKKKDIGNHTLRTS